MSLITTISEFKQYIAIDENTKLATLQPYINEAEVRYIIPLLGQDFYDYFLPLYEDSVKETDPVALSIENADLLPYIQRCLAYYTQLLAIPHLATTFGDLGVRQHRGEDSDPAPRWLIEKLQFNAMENGDLHADKLLEFLEANASDTVYQDWYADEKANTRLSGFIVYGTAIASKHIDINNSRRVYLQLRNRIREIERKIIPKLITQEQYDELITAIADPENATEAQTALIEKLEPVIAKRALYQQLPFMRVRVNERGVFVHSATDSLFLPGQLAGDIDIKALRLQLIDDPDTGYLADERELRQFILDNIDDYPLIKDSTVYTTDVPNTKPVWDTQNDANNKHFAV